MREKTDNWHISIKINSSKCSTTNNNFNNNRSGTHSSFSLRIQRSSVNQTSLYRRRETRLSNIDLAAQVTSIFILIDHRSRATRTLSPCSIWAVLTEKANQVDIMFHLPTRKRMKVLRDPRSLRSSLRLKKVEMSNLMAEIVMWR